MSDATFTDAMRWVLRLNEAGSAEADPPEFRRWLAGSPDHARAYAEAERLWAATAGPARRRDEAAIDALVAQARAGKARRRLRGAMLGLALIGLVALGAPYGRDLVDDLRADYVTPVGATARHVLADGSVIELNTDSAVAVEFGPTGRRVRLFRGEAFLTAARDPARPLVVQTADGDTTVTGTAFNTRLRPGRTVVSLVEGRVRVAPADRPETVAALEPGQEIEISPAGLGQVHPFQASTALAWQRGQMVFFRAPLGQVVDELNRYRRGRIVILDGQLRDLPVTGVFDTRRPAEVIDLIEGTLGVKATRLTGALTLLR